MLKLLKRSTLQAVQPQHVFTAQNYAAASLSAILACLCNAQAKHRLSQLVEIVDSQTGMLHGQEGLQQSFPPTNLISPENFQIKRILESDQSDLPKKRAVQHRFMKYVRTR